MIRRLAVDPLYVPELPPADRPGRQCNWGCVLACVAPGAFWVVVGFVAWRLGQ